MLSPPGLFFPSSYPFSLFSSRAQSYLRTYRCLHAHLRLHAHQKKDHDTVQAVDGSRAFTAVPAVSHSGSDAHVSSQQVLSPPESRKNGMLTYTNWTTTAKLGTFNFCTVDFWGFSTVRIKKTGFLTVVERGFLR